MIGIRYDLRVPPFAKTNHAEQYAGCLDQCAWADRAGLDIAVWTYAADTWSRQPSAGTVLESSQDLLRFPLAVAQNGDGVRHREEPLPVPRDVTQRKWAPRLREFEGDVPLLAGEHADREAAARPGRVQRSGAGPERDEDEQRLQ